MRRSRRCGESPGRRPGRGAALSLLILIALPHVTIGSARAALLVYEPFAYDAGTVLDGVAATGQNLAGSYVPLGPSAFQQLVVESPGLDYGSLVGAPSAAGGRISDVLGVTAAGATIGVGEPVITGPGTTIYWSALFTFDDSENGNHLANITLSDDVTGDRIAFGEAAVGVQAIRVEANTSATGGLLAEGADGAFANGSTMLLVGRYSNGAAPDGDSLDLIGYDTASAVTLPASFDPADPNAAFAFGLSGIDIDLAQITSIAFTIRGLDNNFIDELRIGTTYRDVVPEPAAALLVGLGLAGLGLHARGRRRARSRAMEGAGACRCPATF
jgi:hypothetical protein